MNRYFTASAAAAIAAFATLAGAQTLYKLVDRNGKVTYSETAPKDFPGQVIRIDIDPNRNTATLPKLKEGDLTPADRSRATPAANAATNIQAAREKLEAAKKALADAQQNPGEGDVSFLGNKGGGVRTVSTESYQKRLEALEAQVKAAEAELSRAEGR